MLKSTHVFGKGLVAVVRIALVLVMVLGFVSPVEAAKRVALVIGNSAYVHASPLANPKNDAADVAEKLKTLGFTVTHGEDLNLAAMRETVRKFQKSLEGADLALFYYAGHGLQVNGTNYVVPIDATLAAEEDVGFETMAMDKILAPMERAAPTNLVFLDACRNNPLARNLARSMGTRSAAVGSGLAQLGGGVGTLIAFATQPGNVALDGDGRNSPFTTALLKHIGTPGQDIMKDMVMVRRDVIAATEGKQVPWDNNSLTGDVILQPGEKAVAVVEPLKLPGKKDGAVVAALPDDFVEPTPDNPFDGYWEVTRTATNEGGKSTCGWPSLVSQIEIKNGVFDTKEWKGRLDAKGTLQGFHYFISDEDGKPGRNKLTAKMSGDSGKGKFSMIGGGCRGILTLVRL